MSDSIESKVVQLKFDNSTFEAKVRSTLAALQSLNKGLKLDGATKGLNDVSQATSRFSMGNMANAVDNVAKRFSALSVVAITTLATITTKVLSSASQITNAFTLEPLKQGFSEYETQMGAIQTILSNTAAAGTTLKDVNATLAELNAYSDQTIYNFSEMAKNIGTFTAAGVDLKTATLSIKGIANLAALSGSNSAQASAAMYQLSQAISAGRVSLEDWNSVVNAGMGGTVFQRALAINAEKMGTLDKGAVKLKGSMKNVTIEGKSFRESITAKPGQESWLTSEVLTRTLAQFTGDLSDAALAAQGFDKAQIKAIQSQAKMAKNAATQVKTLSQLFGTLKESAGSGWAQTWALIFGDFEEAKGLFTSVNNVLGGFISRSAEARNKVIGDWKALGGRTALIQGIANAFKALLAFLKPIKDAFRDIFPAATGRDLANLSVSFRNFTKGLLIGAETASKLRRTFAGVFAIFGIGFEIVKQLVGVFIGLFRTAGEGSGGFLETTASIGDFLVGLHEAVKNGEGFKNFFVGLGKVLAAPIKAIRIIASAIKDLFSSAGGVNTDSLTGRLEPIASLGDLISRAWSKTGELLRNVFTKLEPLVSKVSGAFEKLGSALSDALSGADFSTFLDSINTGLFAVIALAIKKFLGGGLLGKGDGLLGTISETFGELTGTLKAMQTQIKANALIKIAGAVALLTASVVALSLIDSEKLTKALVALTVMFTQLIGAMALFALATAGAGMFKLTVLAGGLILLAAAIGILTISVKALSDLEWEELAKGLTGVVALLGALVGVSYGMSAAAPGMIRAGAGLLLIATAVRILVGAVQSLSEMSWKDMAKGLAGTAALLAALGLFTTFARVNAGGVLAGAGIVLLAAGIKVLASALKDIAEMSWSELARGLAGLAGGLLAIGVALTLMPPTTVLSAAAGAIAASALLILHQALESMSEMNWGEIAKGLTVLATSLGIIALAMAGMTTALPGAAALLVISAALNVFVPVLERMGGLSWGTIATGLFVLAAALTVIGVAGALLTPVIPSLFGLAGAVALLGGGMALAGAGVLAFALALTALAAAGAAGAAALVGFIMTILGSVPKMIEMVGNIIVAFAKAIAAATPAVVKAAITVISSLLDAIVKISPKIWDAVGKMLVGFLRAMQRYVPILVTAGANLVIAVMNGLAAKTPAIVSSATNLLVTFLNSVGSQLPKVTDAGVKLIIAFINGVASAIDNNAGALRSAGLNLARAIIDGMTFGLASGAAEVGRKAASVAKGAMDAAKGMLGVNSPSKEFIKIGKSVNEGFLIGLKGDRAKVTATFSNMRAELSRFRADADRDIAAQMKKIDALQQKANAEARARGAKGDNLGNNWGSYTKQINDAIAALVRMRLERGRADAALRTMDRGLQDERNRLQSLATWYDAVAKKLADAKQQLSDAMKTRDDFKKSVTDQYKDLPDITGETKLGDYLESLRKQVVETKAFASMLQKLRALGLNDDVYRELLARGPAAMPFLSELLDSGKTGVKELNELNKSLGTAAAGMGANASQALYQAAVDSAKGLVAGLAKEEKNIKLAMDKIAQYMVNSIKLKLGIRSPSRVFRGLGINTGQGLVEGLNATAKTVSVATENLGDKAVEGLSRSISAISLLNGVDMDMQPTIRPVIDLSDIRKGAITIGSLIGDNMKINPDVAYGQAKSARAGYDKTQWARYDAGQQAAKDAPKLSFVQNNYSPKALGPGEVYRMTRNQISVAKGALGKT